jgi:hypothetical protein
MLPVMVAVLMLPAAIGMKQQMAKIDEQKTSREAAQGK